VNHFQTISELFTEYNFVLHSALQTSTAPKVEEQKKSGGIFCGMNLTEALIASFLLFLFVFFVVRTSTLIVMKNNQS
jgi:hypothetical protein